MTQYPVLQVCLAVIRVDDFAVAVLGHGIDGQVAAQ